MKKVSHILQSSVAARAGSVWIFKFRFDSIRFSISSTQFRFFGFDIPTPPQCKSILVCENTKTESINFHRKFQLKYIDRPAECEGVSDGKSFTLGTVGLSVNLSQQSVLQ